MPKNKMKLFQPTLIRMLFVCILTACFCNSTWNCWIFQIYFFRTFRRSAPAALSQKWNENFSTKIASNSVLLHFQGLLLLLSTKLVDFQNLFFQIFAQVRACILRPKNERKLFQRKSSRILFSYAFSGPAVAIEHKIGGFSKHIFFRFFHRSAPAALRPKNEMKLFQPKLIPILFSCILNACCCYWT